MEKEEIRTKIINRLKEIEAEHGVKILYALESGSRAWGFESSDSDYDVRFIYAHPKDWYLNILPKRDVIEYPIIDEFDYSGWDLRKSLFLMNKSNPVLFEWLKSPIVYARDDFCYAALDGLAARYFSPISSAYHYLHMADGNYRKYLKDDMVKIKKYFYVLRPLLACLWIEKYEQSPPMEFDRLLSLIEDDELLVLINTLLARKKSGVEMGVEAKLDALNHFIEETFVRVRKNVAGFNPCEKPAQSIMEQEFIKILNYVEGG